jgi:hypothetical protein
MDARSDAGSPVEGFESTVERFESTGCEVRGQLAGRRHSLHG